MYEVFPRTTVTNASLHEATIGLLLLLACFYVSCGRECLQPDNLDAGVGGCQLVGPSPDYTWYPRPREVDWGRVMAKDMLSVRGGSAGQTRGIVLDLASEKSQKS